MKPKKRRPARGDNPIAEARAKTISVKGVPLGAIAEVSKAPRPIEPLRSGSGYSVLRPVPDDRKPNWAKWRLMTDAPLWQVVALSCNVEPEKVRFAKDEWMANSTARVFRADEDDAIKDRYSVACNRLGDSKLAAPSTDGRVPAVTMASFAAFADEVGWTLPEEFPRTPTALLPMAQANPSSDDAQRYARSEDGVLKGELLTPRERNTLLVIIGALCKELKIDPLDSSATRRIKAIVDQNGTSISEDTVREKLKLVPAAVDRRQK